jgi:hypothetical protein
MKFGDTVQIKQNFQGRPHWVYARVVSVPADNSGAVVQIAHSCNPEDGQQKIVLRNEIRTKADIQAELDQVQGHDDAAREERRQLQVQVDRLS